MNYQYKEVIDSVLSGMSYKDVSEKYDMTIKNVQRILSTAKGTEYKNVRKLEVNSRKLLSTSERILAMIGRLVESTENQLDLCVTDSDRLKLTDTVLQLTKLVTMPDDVPPAGPLPVAYIPETSSIEQFNRNTLAGSQLEKHIGTKEKEILTPGGSEIPAPEHNIGFQESPPSYDEIDQEFIDEED